MFLHYVVCATNGILIDKIPKGQFDRLLLLSSDLQSLLFSYGACACVWFIIFASSVHIRRSCLFKVLFFFLLSITQLLSRNHLVWTNNCFALDSFLRIILCLVLWNLNFLDEFSLLIHFYSASEFETFVDKQIQKFNKRYLSRSVWVCVWERVYRKNRNKKLINFLC